jgi:hypothetical protein
MVLLSVNSQELFKVAATGFTADIAATHHFLAHTLNYSWRVLVAYTLLVFQFRYQIFFLFHRGITNHILQ